MKSYWTLSKFTRLTMSCAFMYLSLFQNVLLMFIITKHLFFIHETEVKKKNSSYLSNLQSMGKIDMKSANKNIRKNKKNSRNIGTFAR